MYSRYHNRPDRPIRLPENYNGCAFSPTVTANHASNPPEPTRRLEIGKPSPPLFQIARETVENPPITEETPPVQETGLLQASPSLPTLLGREGRIRSLLHGIGFEELLLLGLIFLLAGSEESSDVVLWLVLLLFCG